MSIVEAFWQSTDRMNGFEKQDCRFCFGSGRGFSRAARFERFEFLPPIKRLPDRCKFFQEAFSELFVDKQPRTPSRFDPCCRAQGKRIREHVFQKWAQLSTRFFLKDETISPASCRAGSVRPRRPPGIMAEVWVGSDRVPSK